MYDLQVYSDGKKDITVTKIGFKGHVKRTKLSPFKIETDLFGNKTKYQQSTQSIMFPDKNNQLNW